MWNWSQKRAPMPVMKPGYSRRQLGFLPGDSGGWDDGGGWYEPDYGYWSDSGGWYDPDWAWLDDPTAGTYWTDWTIPIGTETGCPTGTEPGCFNPPRNWWDWNWPTLPTPGGGNPFPPYDDIPPAPAPYSPTLPGYCPAGTYHPMENPMICVPFPPAPPTAPQRPQSNQSPNRPATAARPPQAAPQCPAGYVFDSKLQRCIPTCPKGQIFDARVGKCVPVPTNQPAQNFPELAQKTPWWIWAFLAGTVLLATSNGGGASPGRKR